MASSSVTPLVSRVSSRSRSLRSISLRHGRTIDDRRPVLRRGDQLLKLLSEFAVTLACLMGGQLRRDREEPLLVAGDVALEQRDDVAGHGHDGKLQ